MERGKEKKDGTVSSGGHFVERNEFEEEGESNGGSLIKSRQMEMETWRHGDIE